MTNEYAIVKTIDGNYRAGLPHARSLIEIDVMTVKQLPINTFLTVLRSTQEEANKILSQYL